MGEGSRTLNVSRVLLDSATWNTFEQALIVPLFADAILAEFWGQQGFPLRATVVVRVGDSTIMVDPVEAPVIVLGGADRGLVPLVPLMIPWERVDGCVSEGDLSVEVEVLTPAGKPVETGYRARLQVSFKFE